MSVRRAGEGAAGPGPAAATPVERALAALVFALVAWLAFHDAPTGGDFSWSDAPRHGMNGIFLRDFVASGQFADPRQFATDYYLKYPALTILFYPPLFSVALAVAYTLFGFSHAVGQATVAVFYFALGYGVYLLARRWLDAALAVVAGLLLVGAPEIGFWGRQLMLDIPAYAWLVGFALVFNRYMAQRRARDLYLSVLLLLASLYTKQTSVFVLVPLAVGLACTEGWTLWRSRPAWIAAAMLVLLLVPLVALQLKFGQVNSASLLGSARNDLPRTSLGAWTFYAEAMPAQLGWPTLVLAAVYLLGAAWRPQWRLPIAPMLFFVSWLAAGYLMFSFIMVREPRHDLMVLLPVPLFAALALRQLLADRRWQRAGSALALALALVWPAWAFASRPVPYVGGYREAAAYVAEHAPKGSVVLFSGYRDGSFVFDMRAAPRPDLSVARADKFLFRVAIERERGIQDRQLSIERIEQLIQQHGVRYVVCDPLFWTDLPSMAALNALLADGSRFAVERRIATTANFNAADKELVIYRYLGRTEEPPRPLTAELVGVGVTLQGQR